MRVVEDYVHVYRSMAERPLRIVRRPRRCTWAWEGGKPRGSRRAFEAEPRSEASAELRAAFLTRFGDLELECIDDQWIFPMPAVKAD